MRAKNGAGVPGPEQGVTPDRLLGWQPQMGEDLGSVVKSHDENIMCLRGRKYNIPRAQIKVVYIEDKVRKETTLIEYLLSWM